MKTRNEALSKAQDLIWTAFDLESSKERLALAKTALEICPDCADAYYIIAKEERGLTSEGKIELLEEGVKAGRRALGPSYFKENVGIFWGILETRPYMRAVFGLAMELESANRVEEAIAHYQELLRLNPNDNQGVRYCLVPLLVELNKLKEAQRIFKSYTDDIGPAIAYSHALFLFKKEGDTQKARERLAEAIRWNSHVVRFLLTPKLNRRLRIGHYITVGGDEEALVYARQWRGSWHKSDGAIDWLVENLVSGYQESRGI